MKKTLIAFAAILMLIAMSSYAFSQAKIGIINAQRLVEGTKKGRAIALKLEEIGKAKQDQLKKMQDDVQKLEKELMSPALNDETREKKSLELQNKKTEGKRFIEDTQREMQMITQKEMDNLKREIQPIIQQVGQEKGLHIILEITAVAYFDESIDITEDIIKIMDSKQ